MKIKLFRYLVISLLTSTSIFASPKLPDWQPTHFVWGMGMFLEIDTLPCDHPFDSPISNFSEINNMHTGSTLLIQMEQLQDFYSNVLPNITSPFNLFIGHSDLDFPTGLDSKQSNSYCLKPADIQELLNHPKIIHIFAQNNTFGTSHPKVTSLPIGINYHSDQSKLPKTQESELFDIIASAPPITSRKKGILIDFHFNDSIEWRIRRLGLKDTLNRNEIANILVSNGVGEKLSTFIPRTALWKKKTEYAFSASPPGHGLDCHRTWEDLILGCIVIVQTSPLDCLYEGLPVVIIEDWCEVTPDFLDYWFNFYSETLSSPQYYDQLTQQYWIDKIKEKLRDFDETTK